MSIVTFFVETADGYLEDAAETQFGAVASTVGSILLVSITLLVILVIINMAFQVRSMDGRTAFWLAVKLILVGVFATNWIQFNAFSTAVLTGIDSIAGSRILAQEADFAIGISKTLSGQRYLKPIFYRYAQEEEQVQCFQITEDLWIQPTESSRESDLLYSGEDNLPQIQQEIWEYIEMQSEEQEYITTQELIQTFVETEEVAKASLHRYLKQWQKQGKYQLEWLPQQEQAGIYFLRAKIGEQWKTRKLMLIE